ncbi:MAG: DNA primase [Cryomorphaceae bacterium]|nr:MAG: DNA primase [Cryomorphaceae bacterium]
MKRIIKDYKNITPELLDILNDRYPEGIDEDDLITFSNHLGELVKAVEIRYEDDIYLIKVSKQLAAKMDEAMEDDDSDDDDDDMDDFDTDDSDIADDVDDFDDDDDDTEESPRRRSEEDDDDDDEDDL